MIFDVNHRTTFRYGSVVDISQHMLHLAPRTTDRQILHRHSLITMPTPTLSKDGLDYFGNKTTYLTVEQPHESLTIASTARVETQDDPREADADATSPWDALAARLTAGDANIPFDVQQFSYVSPFTGSADARAYAEPSFPEETCQRIQDPTCQGGKEGERGEISK